MASILESIRSLQNSGILADRKPQSSSLGFRRHNLIYGFNGSGKTTLSRLFASLQAGARDPKLPSTCAFEFSLSDGTLLACPESLSGLERRVMVFNPDFIERNLQWATGRANPVFYIGREQAERLVDLERHEQKLPAAEQRSAVAAAQMKAAEKAASTFKRDQARAVANLLRLRGRKYEAPQLAHDLEKLSPDPGSTLSQAELDAAAEICRMDEPLPHCAEIAPAAPPIKAFLDQAASLLKQTPGTVALGELQVHPDMLLWTRQGYLYHQEHKLESCLLCRGLLSAARREDLGRAFDDKLERFLGALDSALADGRSILTSFATIRRELESLRVSTDLRSAYTDATSALSNEITQCESYLSTVLTVLAEKRRTPTRAEDAPNQTPDAERSTRRVAELFEKVNETIRAHNQAVDGFLDHQAKAQLAVRRHFVATVSQEFGLLVNEQASTKKEETESAADLAKLRQDIERLRSEIREHGPAAETINQLIAAYLGHRELTISAVTDGYEIHRHGRLVEGAPSEGEKTAIALCYFLSTLESEGRSIKDLIVVVDDPVSSLDTKALNFACALVRCRLSDAAQLFILTHNLHCMNEFKKAWKREYRPEDTDKEPAAMFLFLDVTVPPGQTARSARIIEMSKLLREYDSEYHFLFHHVLKFEVSTDPEYEHAYMMPNVLRRVLDVFLAFRCPGSAGLTPKINQLCTENATLDRDRLTALDRLVQMESHSDSLDDLIVFSSMTIEETRAANRALLDMMNTVDPAHLKHLRKLCA